MVLLDTNVLFAAVFQAHAHHETVSRWLATAERYATCGLTQIGTFRLLLTAEATNYSPLTPADAHAVRFFQLGGHGFGSLRLQGMPVKFSDGPESYFPPASAFTS
jgi:predicted nucleic acid-binding protein